MNKKIFYFLAILSAFLFFTPKSGFSQGIDCGEALRIPFNVFNKNSEKELLLTMHTLLSSENEYNRQRSSNQGLNILSSYGTLDYNASKKAVDEAYNKYNLDQTINLTNKEKIDVTRIFASDERVREQLDKWVKCVALKTGNPFVDTLSNTANQVVVRLTLPPNWEGANKVKVAVSYPPTWKLQESYPPRLKTRTTYTYTFVKDDKVKSGDISFDIRNTPGAYAKIPNPAKVVNWVRQPEFIAKFTMDAHRNSYFVTLPGKAPVKTSFPDSYDKGDILIPIPMGLDANDYRVVAGYVNVTKGPVDKFVLKSGSATNEGKLEPSFVLNRRKRLTNADMVIIYEKKVISK